MSGVDGCFLPHDVIKGQIGMEYSQDQPFIGLVAWGYDESVMSEAQWGGEALPPSVLEWIMLPTPRLQRRYLEAHPELFAVSTLSAFSTWMIALSRQTEKCDVLYKMSCVLHDAASRGGNVTAIRDAYVNVYGALVLDIPLWMYVHERQLDVYMQKRQWFAYVERRVSLLTDMRRRLAGDESIAPEIVAQVNYELARAWIGSQGVELNQRLEQAIEVCGEALRAFTRERYPYQFARLQIVLGNAFRDRSMENRGANIEQALTCYQRALDLLPADTFPEEYSQLLYTLGIAWWQRIAGERRINIEQALSYLQRALQFQRRMGLEYDYAATQNVRGNVYWHRIIGEKRSNIEEAITCYGESLRIWTPVEYPTEYAKAQNNLGLAYHKRVVGVRRDNLRQAVACFSQALRVQESMTHSLDYARTQNNLGNVYRDFLARNEDERSEYVERAIGFYTEALSILTQETYPFYYAGELQNLGETYLHRRSGTREENIEQALRYLRSAAQIYTQENYPHAFRTIQLDIAEAEAECGHWLAAYTAYRQALATEEDLLAQGSGISGRAAVLKEGRDATIRASYALTRLSRQQEAAVLLEQGRTRGIAEALALDAADPELITDAGRQERYRVARQQFVDAQLQLATLSPLQYDESTSRQYELAHVAIYHQARAAFTAIVDEIRLAHDPDDFLFAPLQTGELLSIVERLAPAHVVVYLAATPWGGFALAVSGGKREVAPDSTACSLLDLPELTEQMLHDLVERRFADGLEGIHGGFGLAQTGAGFAQLLQDWPGDTFSASATAIRKACDEQHVQSTLAQAVQGTIQLQLCAELAARPLADLDIVERCMLEDTLTERFLSYELQYCCTRLLPVLRQVETWVQQQGMQSMTIIPCGSLAAFPLSSLALLAGEQAGDLSFPISVAPNMRVLQRQENPRRVRTEIRTLGDPVGNLQWSEAEALTLTILARRHKLPSRVWTRRQATRKNFLDAVETAYVVDACCHGTFNTQHALQSALLFAHRGKVTLGELLSHQADMRGLRLLMLSACQTAILDLEGARDEVSNLASAMLQAGAEAVLASLWSVDDRATFLLMVRFAQEWFPRMRQDAPAQALARAQNWLRTVTNAELATWQNGLVTPLAALPARAIPTMLALRGRQQLLQRFRKLKADSEDLMMTRLHTLRFTEDSAQLAIRVVASKAVPDERPYADPYYWAGFQVVGW